MTVIPIFLDISGGEFLVIFLAVFLVFGPKKVPEIARQIGKTMNDLKKATADLSREFQEGAEQVKREVDNVKSGLLSETENLKSQLTNVSQEAKQEVNQLVNSINREVKPDISGRNQAEVFRQAEEPKVSADTKEITQKAGEDDFTPII